MNALTNIKRLDRIIKGLNELADQYERRGNHTRASTLRFQAEVVKEGERLALMNEAGIDQRQVSTNPHDLCRCGHERSKHGWSYLHKWNPHAPQNVRDLCIPDCCGMKTYDGQSFSCGCKSFLTDPNSLSKNLTRGP